MPTTAGIASRLKPGKCNPGLPCGWQDDAIQIFEASLLSSRVYTAGKLKSEVITELRYSDIGSSCLNY